MKAHDSQAERRNYHRVPMVCDVWQRECRPEFGMCGMAGRTLNLSDGGALIQVTDLPEEAFNQPHPGQSIELTLALPRSTLDTFLLEHVRIRGEVVRVGSHGTDQPPSTVAVRFGQPMSLQLD